MLWTRPDKFQLYEVLPRDTFDLYYPRLGDQLWSIVFDDRLMYTQDRLRKRYGVITVNDYWWGGPNEFRGYRPECCPVGAVWSDHKRGTALDNFFKQEAAAQVREDILSDPWHDDFKFITCIEANTPHLHFSTRNWNKQKHGILIL